MKGEQKQLLVIILILFGLTGWIIGQEAQLIISIHSFNDTTQIFYPNNHKIAETQILTSHAPIFIANNDQFTSKGFLGSGTSEDPYRIENLNITNPNDDLISISNTTVHFIIKDNLLDGLTTATSGISLSNVKHCTIENNLIRSNEDGIKAVNTYSSIFHNNSIYENGRIGCFLIKATNCTLTSNTIHDNLANGIHLKDTSNTTILSNIIYNHQNGEYFYSGILLDNSSKVHIIYNSLFDNHYGINLLTSVIDNLIVNNTIYENQLHGIRLEYATKTTIIHNTIINNGLYGIKTTIGSQENTIQFNNFTGNNEGGTQASDDGKNNRFKGNYWDEWNKTDDNNDLIIDIPYSISGTARNTDPYPLMELSSESIKNVQEKTTTPELLPFIFTILSLIGGSTGIGYFLYKKRVPAQETFIEFILSDKIESLKAIYHKLIVGLDNIKNIGFIGVEEIPKLPPALEDQSSLIGYFPSEIRDDLQSGIKIRTVLTLTEIAYQDPSETNLIHLSKVLDLPTSTLSNEIKKLEELGYIEYFVSSKVLEDARYRTYSITPKGITLLNMLKDALRLAITRLKKDKSIDVT